jgi:methyl-accepting chemotaxis protein
MKKIGKSYDNLNIATKLISGFLIVAVIAGIIGIIGVVCLNDSDSKYVNLYNDYGKSQGVLGNIGIDYQKTRSAMKEALITQNDATSKQNDVENLKIYDKDIDANLAVFYKTINTSAGEKSYNELVDLLKQYRTTRDQVVALAIQNKYVEANVLGHNVLAPIVTKLDANFQSTFARKINDGDALANQYAASNLQTIYVLWIIIILAVIISILLGLLISNKITKPIKKITKAADLLAEGNTDLNIDIDRKDEVGRLAGSFGRMAATIKALITETLNIANAAENGDLTVRADESRFSGDYYSIVQGMNNTVSAFNTPISIVVGQLEKLADGAELNELKNDYQGTYGILIDNLNKVRASLYVLLGGAANLSTHSSQGDLQFRVDTSEIKGGFAEIIQGFNSTLDNIIVPLDKSMKVLKEMAVGNNDIRVEGVFKGDLKDLTDGVNATATIINNAVNDTAKAITEISQGHLDIEKMREFRGSWNPISVSVNSLLDSLSQTMTDINISADQVASGSKQVSNASQALSQGTTEQASSIEELTASITEIAAQTRQNASFAADANKIAIQSQSDAQKGNDHMKDLLKSMVEINQASANISNIVKVIDSIAFQTNMLALNAAVEAARAGQYGKGFAVVAEEVRNLAARSAAAVKDTTTIIEGTITKAQAGSEIANETAAFFQKIVDGLEKNAELVSNIATASNDQATGISQINSGIEQVSQVVQTNSATAEESAASSEELSAQAELLKDMVGKFRLKHNEIQRIGSVANKSSKARTPYDLAAATSEKRKISLNSVDFGKY